MNLKPAAILKNEKFFVMLAVLGLALLSYFRPSPRQTFELVNWPTIGALFGLMLLSYGLEESGYLQWVGTQFLRKARSLRSVAFLFLIGAAFLSAIITNDIALFIVIPLVLEVSRRVRDFPTGRLVIFMALAVNVGSSLTPIGNPQNLILWQISHVTFFKFAEVMLPFAVSIFFVLAALTAIAFAGRPLDVHSLAEPRTLDKRMMIMSLISYPIFLVAIEHKFLWFALAALIALFGILARPIFRRLDWVLIAIFVLMFVDFKMLAVLPIVQHSAKQMLSFHDGAFSSGILFSQLLSNVPATILLQSYHPSWQRLAWGVNAGGFGLIIGSLANLIALRLSRIKGLWRQFHFWSLAMLIISFIVGWLL